MEDSPEEIVRIPTLVLAELMKKARKQSREIKNLKRVVATLNETIKFHNQAWDDLYDKVTEMGEEIDNMNAQNNQDANPPPLAQETDILDELSDAMTDEHLYRDWLDFPI